MRLWLGAIYSVSPYTFQTEIVPNPYFGASLNGPDDVTWGAFPLVSHSHNTSNSTTNLTKQEQKPVMFFTNVNGWGYIAGYSGSPGLPDAVWQFSPSDSLLTPVVSRADVLVPNIVRVNKEFTKIYVTDSTTPQSAGFNATDSGVGAAAYSGSPAIYSFDLTSDGFPINKRLTSISRHEISDGLHIDDEGRVWTGEYEGVVVKTSEGRVLSIFNSDCLLIEGGVGKGQYGYNFANFALAGDTLVILAV